jgi:hypothetical protein
LASTTTIEARAAKHEQEQLRRRDAAQATLDYETKRQAMLAKTERLRAERLARDAALAVEAAAAAPAPAPTSKSRKKAAAR